MPKQIPPAASQICNFDGICAGARVRLQSNILNVAFGSHVTIVSKFTEERKFLSDMCAGAAMPEPNLLILGWDEVILSNTFA